MKNLFNFATKELSQDAFLRWLFENYDCEDPTVRAASIKVLSKLCKTDFSKEKIKVWTKPQQNHMDITVIIDTDSEKIGLFIEDKVFSGEHNQLERYNKAIDQIEKSWGIKKVYKAYYKTDDLYQWERETNANIDIAYWERLEFKAVKDANWDLYDIYQINDIFREYINCQNDILRDYANHIAHMTDQLKNTKMPYEEGERPFLDWKAYFHREIASKIIDKCSPYVGIGQYPYAYLQIHLKDKGEKKLPYLEIQSRDCTKNKFVGRILLYGTNLDLDQAKVLQKKLSENKDNPFEFKGTRKNSPKQLGYTKEFTDVNDTDTFMQHLNVCIDAYLKMMEAWPSVSQQNFNA